jgi:hypothetical protein
MTPGTVDSFLRGEQAFAVGRREVPWRSLLTMLAMGGLGYGFAMGLYGGRPLQGIYSALKVPILLMISSALCLPNFFVVNTLLGLRADFQAALRGVVAAQVAVAVTLASLAPVILFSYATTDDHDTALLMNGVLFAVATTAGQLVLNRYYEELVRRDPRHRIGRVSWTVLYVFVAIQLAWVLRPFVGAPDLPVAFFRDDAWSNAYVVVGRLVMSILAD